MVRVFIKGGVWKNSEDEILKAAVMKYGKQQWARVASFLNRKSAKQCKARWHEWLDPAVKKVEWSRAEEEKLLHLAKLMPAQWRTIAPLIGRTAAQCQEHYEKLLDEAAAGDDSNAKLRDSQQLRPGQIDSHPETKPARPDPIDMDEDEIEMLQEARARLANTQGKKAKRKAREKMLAEAKRLADLQKRRELKQAGLLSSAARKRARKRNRDIDLGVEIPFHKPAPAGFHDVSAEAARTESIRHKRLKQVDYKKINENQYRTRDREAAQAQKREEARLRNLERSNMQYVVAQVSKTNDPLSTQKRGALELPAPTVSDKELGQLAKLTAAQQQESSVASSTDANNSATQALLGDYSDKSLPTPMRTPMTGKSSTSGHEDIMRQASNLRMLETGQTPLLGGENPELLAAAAKNDDTTAMAATPGVPGRLGGETPMTAAPRDELGLNRGEVRDDASVGASTFATSTTMSIKELAREERRAAKRARKQLEEALAALPAPQFEYELAAPETMDDDERPVVETVVEDAADEEAAERQRLQREAERLYEARSSVVKRKDLPRPAGAIRDEYGHSADLAKQLIQQEMVTLLRHDAHAYPVTDNGDKKKKKKRKKAAIEELPPESPLDYIPEKALDMAKNLVQAETEAVLQETNSSILASGQYKSDQDSLELLAHENKIASQDGIDGLVHLKEGWGKPKDEAQLVEAKSTEFETIQEATAALRKRNDKLESKAAVKHGGYAKRAETLRESLLEKFAVLQNTKIEQAVFTSLQSHESRGGPQRIERLQEELSQLEESEAAEQKRYANLLLEKKRLLLKLKSSN